MLNTLMITAAPARWALSSHAGSILSSYKRASYNIPTLCFLHLHSQLSATPSTSIVRHTNRVSFISRQRTPIPKKFAGFLIYGIVRSWTIHFRLGNNRLFRNVSKNLWVEEIRKVEKVFSFSGMRIIFILWISRSFMTESGI